jgi:hypothetical protein
MDDWPTKYYELRFRVDFLERKAAAFQDLFVAVMSKAYPKDFMPCRPWGRAGDRKNDGYLPSEKLLCQVYAPNELTSRQTVKKIETDFKGALPHWRKYFRTWAFVHNADALPPDVLKKILSLRRRYPSIKIETWGFEALKLQFQKLNRNAMSTLYGHPPPVVRKAPTTLGKKRAKTVPHLVDVLRVMRAASPTDFRAVVIGICDECMEYYRTLFRPVYENTVQILQALPLEPAREIFQAFDHFGRATEVTTKIPAGSHHANYSHELSKAFLEVERARMHIAVGIFYCYEHQVLWFQYALDKLAGEWRARFPADDGGPNDKIFTSLQTLVDELVQRQQGLTLKLKPVRSISESVREIAKIELASERLCEVLVGYMEVHKTLCDRLGRGMSKSAHAAEAGGSMRALSLSPKT